MRSTARSVSHRVLTLLGTLVFTWGTASAQSGKAVGTSQAGDAWQISPVASVNSESDNNVFRLSPTRKDDVASPSAGDLASGRFAQMGSASDVIVTMTGGLQASGPGFFGRTMTVTPLLDYERYVWNAQRSNVTLGASVVQSLPHEGRMRAHARLRPSYFVKNYLSDAVDRNGDGSIAAAERMYTPGEYREGEIGFDYRHRLADASRRRPFGAWLLARVGYMDRAFDAPHVGRDLNGPSAGATLRLELGRDVVAEGSYDIESLTGLPSSQVLLLDEPRFGQDFNRNGRVADTNVRVVATVDPSRTAQTFGGALRFELGGGKDLAVHYDRRWRTYTSMQPLDATYNGRRDWRDRFGAELSARLSREVRLKLGGGYATQRLNRESDLGGIGEIDDYSKFQAHIGLSFER